MADPNRKEKRENPTDNTPSVSQADGAGETQSQPNPENRQNQPQASGQQARGENQSSGGRNQQINPSEPTQGTEGGQRTNLGSQGRDRSLQDSAGEVGGSDNLGIGQPGDGPNPTTQKPATEGAGDVQREKEGKEEEAA